MARFFAHCSFSETSDGDLMRSGRIAGSRSRGRFYSARSDEERVDVSDANVFLQNSDISTCNGDDSDFEACENDPGFICEREEDEEELILDQNDNPISASDDVEGSTVNRMNTSQDLSALPEASLRRESLPRPKQEKQRNSNFSGTCCRSRAYSAVLGVYAERFR